MSQANRACTTRRGLFGGMAIAAGAAAAVALPAAALPRERTPAERLIDRLEGAWGAEGRRIAEMAVADGFIDDDLYTIIVGPPDDNTPTILLDGKSRGLGLATYPSTTRS